MSTSPVRLSKEIAIRILKEEELIDKSGEAYINEKMADADWPVLVELVKILMWEKYAMTHGILGAQPRVRTAETIDIKLRTIDMGKVRTRYVSVTVDKPSMKVSGRNWRVVFYELLCCGCIPSSIGG